MALTDPDPAPTDPDEWLRREVALQRLRDHGVRRIHACGSRIPVELLEFFAGHFDLPAEERAKAEWVGTRPDTAAAPTRSPEDANLRENVVRARWWRRVLGRRRSRLSCRT
jgi:hypothetical protein